MYILMVAAMLLLSTAVLPLAARAQLSSNPLLDQTLKQQASMKQYPNGPRRSLRRYRY